MTTWNVLRSWQSLRNIYKVWLANGEIYYFFSIISMIGLYQIGRTNLTNGLLLWWRYLTRFDLLFIWLYCWRNENRAIVSSVSACISKLLMKFCHVYQLISSELIILRRLMNNNYFHIVKCGIKFNCHIARLLVGVIKMKTTSHFIHHWILCCLATVVIVWPSSL